MALRPAIRRYVGRPIPYEPIIGSYSQGLAVTKSFQVRARGAKMDSVDATMWETGSAFGSHVSCAHVFVIELRLGYSTGEWIEKFDFFHKVVLKFGGA